MHRWLLLFFEMKKAGTDNWIGLSRFTKILGNSRPYNKNAVGILWFIHKMTCFNYEIPKINLFLQESQTYC